MKTVYFRYTVTILVINYFFFLKKTKTKKPKKNKIIDGVNSLHSDLVAVYGIYPGQFISYLVQPNTTDIIPPLRRRGDTLFYPYLCFPLYQFFVSQFSQQLLITVEHLAHSSCRYAICWDLFFWKFDYNFLFTEDLFFYYIFLKVEIFVTLFSATNLRSSIKF